MGRGQGQGQGQSPGYGGSGAGGVPNQLPSLGGERPEELVAQYEQFGRAFGGGGHPGQHGGGASAMAFRPGANQSPMSPQGALPITAASGPASTQGSPVAPTPSGVNPQAPGTTAGAAPTPGGPAEPGQVPGAPQAPGSMSPGVSQMAMAQALRR